MNDQSGLQTPWLALYRETESAPVKRTVLDSSRLANRIRDNLNWALAFDRRSSPARPADVWSEIVAMWHASDEDFVSGLYEVVLGRPPDPLSLETSCAVLASGGPRTALVRILALGAEAAAAQLDVHWLPRLEELEPDAVWTKLQALWAKPDRAFVASLYPLLLFRPPEWDGVAAHCLAMKAGTSRAYVVRAIALSDEARMRGLSVSWLPRLEELPTAPPTQPPMSLSWLKKAYRRWRNGMKRLSSLRRPYKDGTQQFVGAATEGERP